MKERPERSTSIFDLLGVGAPKNRSQQEPHITRIHEQMQGNIPRGNPSLKIGERGGRSAKGANRDLPTALISSWWCGFEWTMQVLWTQWWWQQPLILQRTLERLFFLATLCSQDTNVWWKMWPGRTHQHLQESHNLKRSFKDIKVQSLPLTLSGIAKR